MVLCACPARVVRHRQRPSRLEAWWAVSWLIAGVLLLACGLYVVLTPLRIRGEGHASSEAAACGTLSAAWGPIALRLERTRPEARLAVLLLGRKVMERALAKAPSRPGTPRKPRSSLPSLGRRIRAVDAVRFVAGQRHNIRFDVLEGQLSFGFADPALTGQLYGVLCGLRSALPAGFYLEADWSCVDRFALQTRVAVRIFVVRIVLASAFFALVQWVLRPGRSVRKSRGDQCLAGSAPQEPAMERRPFRFTVRRGCAPRVWDAEGVPKRGERP
jgi:hypothetical protein